MRVGGRVTTLAWAALLGACSVAPPSPYNPMPGAEGEGIIGSWVHSGDYRRDYILDTPAALDGSGSYPLLVMMHGAGGSAAGLRAWTGMDSAATRAGYITAFPEGLDASWNIGCAACTSAAMKGIDDLRFIQTLVRHLADSLPVDTTRVFLVGHSLGAQFVHHFACEAEMAPAGIAAVSGLWLRRTAASCLPRGIFSVLMINGDQDDILPWDGARYNASVLAVPNALERWAELLECTGRPEVTERPDTAGDGTSVQTTSHDQCRGGMSVALQRIRGGGHGWPGASRAVERLGTATGNLDGVREVLSFFRPYAVGR